MGSCFSSNSNPTPHSTGKVITLNGRLREYSTPVTVCKVMQSESTTQPLCFLCSSDQLYYNECIQSLPPTDELQLGQIYFILPRTRLNNPLSASDMVDLAVKASSAIGKGSRRGNRRQKFIRLSPQSKVNQRLNEERFDEVKRFKEEKVKAPAVSRSGSVRSLQRCASRRAKLAMRSFRSRLSVIPECGIAEKEYE